MRSKRSRMSSVATATLSASRTARWSCALRIHLRGRRSIGPGTHRLNLQHHHHELAKQGDALFTCDRRSSCSSRPVPRYGMRYGFAPATADFQRLRGRPPLVSPLKSCMSRSFTAVDGRFGRRGSRSKKRLQQLKTPPSNVENSGPARNATSASTSSTCPKQLSAMTDGLIGDRSFAIFCDILC